MKIYFILTFVLFVCSSFIAESKWEIAKNKDGIKVYTRKAEGSNIKEFKAISYVTTDMHLLVDLIENVENYPSWQANISTSKILKKVNKLEKYFSSSTDMPWPITDRDMVMYSKKLITEDIITFNIEGMPQYIDEKEGYLRLPEIKGKWQFEKQDDRKIKVIYQFYGDPGGNLPNWLINAFIVDGPFETLSNISKKFE